MKIILSPSKTIDQSGSRSFPEFNIPYYIEDSSKITEKLSGYKVAELAKLLESSNKIAELTYDRYQFWSKDHNLNNAKQAILSFKGDVFTGLDADTFTNDDLEYANEHLIIFSGLYGILQALDLIQPYRLEIAAKLKLGRSNNLYHFWKDKVTSRLIELLQVEDNPVIINLASNEYLKSFDAKKIAFPIITPVFKELKGDTFKVVSIYAKRARGLLSSYLIRNRITIPEEIKHFSEEGYFYNDKLSSDNEIVFTRG